MFILKNIIHCFSEIPLEPGTRYFRFSLNLGTLEGETVMVPDG